MNDYLSFMKHQHLKARTGRLERLNIQSGNYSQKRLQEVKAREFWNRRDLAVQVPIRKAA